MTKLGLALPTSGPEASPETITSTAEGAERIGLASVWTFERLMRPIHGATPIGGGDDVPLPEGYGCVYDPVETLAYVAARTTAITLGTSVLDALLHSPIVLARRLATLDRLSGGRLVAGLGQGWMAAEFEAAGVPATPRGPGWRSTSPRCGRYGQRTRSPMTAALTGSRRRGSRQSQSDRAELTCWQERWRRLQLSGQRGWASG